MLAEEKLKPLRRDFRDSDSCKRLSVKKTPTEIFESYPHK